MLMSIIYHFLKLVTLITFWGFYGRTIIINKKNLRLKGPTILVSNHPNTLIDPLQVAARVNRIVYFLANASLFKTPFQNWFFNTFFCIPVERPEDTNGKPIQNTQNFARADQHLSKGRILYIAPEGYSYKGRKLMKVKTGTARIALSAEQANDFKLGLKILPVGLNYESPYKSRSKIWIHVGEPIEASSYKAAYEENSFSAARALTDTLEENMRSLILHTNDPREDKLLHYMEKIAQQENPLPQKENYFRSKDLLASLQAWRAKEETSWEIFATDLEQYFDLLENKRLEDSNVACSGSCGILGRSLVAFLGLPFFLYGWLNNFLPAYIPVFLVRKLKLSVEYDATVKTITSLITFPLFYRLQYGLLDQWLSSPFPLLYLLSLIPLGLLAWELKKRYGHLIRQWRWQQYRRKKPELVRELCKMRAGILEKIRREKIHNL